MKRWTRIKYQPNLPLYDHTYVTCSKKHLALAKEAALEGCVLMKNENQTLPLQQGSRVALFGIGSADYVKGGGGSADVAVEKTITLYDSLKELKIVEPFEPANTFYTEQVKQQYELEDAVPGMTREPKLPSKLLQNARAFTDTAILVFSRFSGEGWDRSSIECFEATDPWDNQNTMPKRAGKYFPDGDFYLTEEEHELVRDVLSEFQKVIVVLNIGGVIESQWFKEDPQIAAVLNIWQGGMEGNRAAAELLCGLSNPSGKLTDTFAKSLDSYPSTAGFHDSFDYVDYSEDIYVGYRYFETIPEKRKEVVYPFGFGLSYTTFELHTEHVWEEADGFGFEVRVKNTGSFSGKEVVQIYYSAPQGLLGKPEKELGAFAKTKELAPGEEQVLRLYITKAQMASYDDLGKIQKSAYLLEKGVYRFAIGNSVEDAVFCDFLWELPGNVITEQLQSKCAPVSLAKRMRSDGTYEDLPMSDARNINESVIPKMIPGSEEALTPMVKAQPRRLLLNPLKEGILPLESVADGEITLDQFMEQLSDQDLLELLGGQPNLSVADTHGFGNQPQYGIPNVMTADGPAGLRLEKDRGVFTTAWPCTTQIACTWNTDLAYRVAQAGAEEVKEQNISMWLTPAVNIHRNPLCGRNFEYYSEDPFLTGTMGAAAVKGIQSLHIAASVKHFACNNKETNRKHSDSRVSERALREIYLKAFEIIVKEANPWSMMSSYNAINGYRASENKELLEDILRGEWNFSGMVTTDWWTRGEHYKEILAGNDLKMACGFPERVEAAIQAGAPVDRSNYEHCARRILELILKFD